MDIKPKAYTFVGECPLGHSALVGEECDRCGMVAEVAVWWTRSKADQPSAGHEAEGREGA